MLSWPGLPVVCTAGGGVDSLVGVRKLGSARATKFPAAKSRHRSYGRLYSLHRLVTSHARRYRTEGFLQHTSIEMPFSSDRS